MKKIVSIITTILLLVTLAFCLTGCQKSETKQKTDQPNIAQTDTASQSQYTPSGENMVEGAIDYGNSQTFSKEDLDAAIKVINDEASMWNGITLKNVHYAGDQAATPEKLKWINGLEKGKNYTQVVEFLSDIEASQDATDGIWEPGETYKDYTWWLARTDGGEWSLMAWGYQ